MSSTLNPVSATDLQTDKPAIETSVDKQTSSESTNQAENLNSDTNSITQHEISPLKRNVSEISGIPDNQTPAKSTKKSRIDRFKEESEALLKSFGLKEGTDSEKRLTRSSTRATPTTTPVSKPESKKATTGAKRGRKVINEKKEDDDTSAVKTSQKKGGRTGGKYSRKQDDNLIETTENNENVEALEESKSTDIVSDDKNDIEEPDNKMIESNDVNEDTKTAVQSVAVINAKISNESINEVTLERNDQEEKIATNTEVKEESKSFSNEESINTNSTSEQIIEKAHFVANDTKIENNTSNSTSTTNNQTNEHVKKIVTETDETPTKSIEEKVSSNEVKLSESSVVEKQELQTV